MPIQTIFKTGNSYVVAIPKSLAKETNLKLGTKVVVEKTDNNQGVIVTKKTSPKKPPSPKEFKQWLKKAIEENGDILDELAIS